MASKTAELLTQIREGKADLGALREHAQKELEILTKAHGESQVGGYMATKDLLNGDTEQTKEDDLIARTEDLRKAQDFLTSRLMIDKNMADLKARASLFTGGSGGPSPDDIAKAQAQGNNLPPPPTPFDRQKNAASGTKNELPDHYGAGTLMDVHYKAMLDDGIYQEFASYGYEDRKRQIYVGRPLAQTRTKDYVPALKAAYAFAGVAAPGGIMPSDMVGMPYPMMTNELDYVMMTAAPGSLIRYFQSAAPVAVDLASGDWTTGNRPRPVDRAMAITTRTPTGAVTARTKQRLAGLIKMDLEDLRDNGQIGERNNMQLDVDVRNLMAQQIFNGTGSNHQWNGILSDFDTPVSATPAQNNIGGLGLGHNTVAVQSTGTDREPVAFMDQVWGELILRGCPPGVLFVTKPLWSEIRKSQRALRYLDEDYAKAPYGRVGPVPMCLSRYMPANEALMVDNMKAFGVELGVQVETAISDDWAFDEYAVSIRRVVSGNTYMLMPFGGIRITGTNNFVAATP